MEGKYQAFRYLIDLCFQTSPEKGLLVFPNYSAYRLGIERDTIKSSGDLKDYFYSLKLQLEKDIEKYIQRTINLDTENTTLISALTEAGLLSEDDSETFDQKKYNSILKRGRDFWLKYFLLLYDYEISLNTFDLWAYRAKQIGLLHITQFYPDSDFNGRVVYPLSVIREGEAAKSFVPMFAYSDGKHLYRRNPAWPERENQEEFVHALHTAYIEARQASRNYFVSLPSVRERVCYNMRIPEYLFDDFFKSCLSETSTTQNQHIA